MDDDDEGPRMAGNHLVVSENQCVSVFHSWTSEGSGGISYNARLLEKTAIFLQESIKDHLVTFGRS